MSENHRLILCWSAVLVTTCTAGPSQNASSVSETPGAPADLSCEYRITPLGMDVRKPRLSWALGAETETQSAYQILVGTRRDLLEQGDADVWDSGKVLSEQSVHAEYEGKPLASSTRYYWTARTWNASDQASPYSRPTWWETGLLEQQDWVARWISPWPDNQPPPDDQPAPRLRHDFDVAGEVVRARAYVAGVGYHTLYLNGTKVGDHELDPAFTDYGRRVPYVTHDVTNLLQAGPNAVGAELGSGWYNVHTQAAWSFNQASWRAAPALLLQLQIDYADGRTKTVASDDTWHYRSGPVIWESIRNGERHDGRLEDPTWTKPPLGRQGWESAHVVQGPAGRLSAQMIQPIRVMQTLDATELREVEPGVFVYDFGQNIAGRAELVASGTAGTEVTLRYAERLYEDGRIDQSDTGRFIDEGPVQTDRFILAGRSTESLESRYTYHGFRYLELTGFPGTPKLDSVKAKVLHTSFDSAGSFTSSSPLLNSVYDATRWSFIGNFHGYPTDCPQREKNGWTADAHLAAEFGLLNYRTGAAYTKWMQDISDAQTAEGKLPGIVPTGGWGYEIAWLDDPKGFGPAWDGALVLVPWYMYLYRGDDRILATHYDAMKRYLAFLGSTARNHIIDHGLDDWSSAKTKTERDVIQTMYYYALVDTVSRIAEGLGHQGDSQSFQELSEDIKASFNATFYDPIRGFYANGSQTAQSCALYFGLTTSENQQAVLDRLLQSLGESDEHLDVGIFGAKCILHALTNHGHAELAYRLASQDTFPSWGYWIHQGATTLWEDWQGGGSRNHVMFGEVAAWFQKALAGIRPDATSPGFKHVFIEPQVVPGLDRVQAEHNSPYGVIASGWQVDGQRLQLDIRIPPNSRAKVILPTNDLDTVTESSGEYKESTNAGRPSYIAGAGSHRFVLQPFVR